MNLYLLRHADAIDHAETDMGRYLSEKGIAQAKVVGKFCRENDIAPDIVLSSPYRRTEETANIVAKKLENAEVLIAPFLSSGMVPAAALEGLAPYSHLHTVMIVGHEPDFGLLAARLLGLPEPRRLHIRKASLTLLELTELEAGAATLHFVIPAKFMDR